MPLVILQYLYSLQIKGDSKKKKYYDRQSVGLSVLVSGAHLRPASQYIRSDDLREISTIPRLHVQSCMLCYNWVSCLSEASETCNKEVEADHWYADLRRMKTKSLFAISVNLPFFRVFKHSGYIPVMGS
jgi:hypothetical protein